MVNYLCNCLISLVHPLPTNLDAPKSTMEQGRERKSFVRMRDRMSIRHSRWVIPNPKSLSPKGLERP